jgi:hypothetical protein
LEDRCSSYQLYNYRLVSRILNRKYSVSAVLVRALRFSVAPEALYVRQLRQAGVLVEQNQIIATAGVQRAQLFVRNFGRLSVESL